MSKRAKIIVRVIGIFLMLSCFVTGYLSIKEPGFNGLEFYTMFVWWIGALLTAGSEKTLIGLTHLEYLDEYEDEYEDE